MKITLADLRRWDACHSDAELLTMARRLRCRHGITPLRLARSRSVTEDDRLWSLLRPEVLGTQFIPLLCRYVDRAAGHAAVSLDIAGLGDHADRLRALTPATHEALAAIEDAGRTAAGAAGRTAAGAAAWDVAMAARSTARCAVWWAWFARDEARDEAGAAWCSAREAREAAWFAAGYAAGHARDFSGGAARAVETRWQLQLLAQVLEEAGDD